MINRRNAMIKRKTGIAGKITKKLTITAASTKFRTKTTGTDSSYRMVGNALSEILFLSDP